MGTKPLIVFYGKCGGLSDVGFIVKRAVGDYVAMLVCSSCVGFKSLNLGILVRVVLVVQITFDHGPL